jgi:hypothetical protein
MTVLATTILVPAYVDLEEARWHRDRAAAVERYHLQRLDRYAAFIDAVDRADETVITALAATQLNLVPEGRQPVAPAADPARTSASVFPLLEPDPPVMPERPQGADFSILGRIATGERTRLWAIGAGALCILLGILPPASRPRPAP